MKKSDVVRVKSSRSYVLYGVLSLVGIFVCGVMAGNGIKGYKTVKKAVKPWGDFTCSNLRDRMLGSETTAEKLKELRRLYAEYCAREQEPVKVEVKEVVEEDLAQKQDCEIIEEIHLSDLQDVLSYNVEDHRANVETYQKLLAYGCEQNKQKYIEALAREEQIIKSMEENVEEKASCENLEASLLNRLPYGGVEADTEVRIQRAKIYANLSERGCAHNKDKYVNLAKQELEIARALRDDEFRHEEANEVAETYKRINMQVKAEEIIDIAGEAAKKLINPTIDFFQQVEKIVNE